MTSIIKVDQIQNAAGGVPTAGDLGLNTTGTIVQVKDLFFGDETQVTTTAYTFLTGSTLSFTPKFDNSRILVDMKVFCNLYDSNGSNPGGAYQLYKDGTQVSSQPSYALYANIVGATRVDVYGLYSSQYAYDNTSTSEVTFALYGREYQSGSDRFGVNMGGGTSSITIFEIAG